MLGLTKYHVTTFIANIYALIISFFFVRAYALKNKPMLPVFLIFLFAVIIFLTIVYFIIKPAEGIKSFIPKKNYLLFNLIISAVFSLFFVREIGFIGLLYLMGFSFLIFDVEHVLFDGVKKWHS